ncbi:MAG: SDR family oxidoreductase [Actinobacteria bacterium]|nr:SDR family oxidoreductase [Actinomycetota bacterium]
MVKRDSSLPDLGGQRVLITGATGGLGQGISRRFAAAGAHVAVHYRSSKAAALAVVEELREAGGEAEAVHADLGVPGSAEKLVALAAKKLGGLDGLVNNAGIQPLATLSEMTRAEWDAVFATNLGAVFELSQAAAAVMGEGDAARDSSSNRWITHVASIEASRPAAAHGHYAAAKAGLVMHARAAALELGEWGIRVNTVSPGLIDRPGLETEWAEGVESWRAHAPLGRMGTPEDIGNACVLLASAGASFITGQDLPVDGGMLVTPGW